MIVNYDFGSGELSTIFKKNFEEVSKEADSFFTKTQGWDLSYFAKSANGFDDLIDKLNITDTSLINFLTDVNQSEKSLTAYQKYLKQTSSATSPLSTITSGAGKVLKIFAATAVNAFASVVVAKVIQEIYEAYDQWANRIEYAAEAMESANTPRVLLHRSI